MVNIWALVSLPHSRLHCGDILINLALPSGFAPAQLTLAALDAACSREQGPAPLFPALAAWWQHQSRGNAAFFYVPAHVQSTSRVNPSPLERHMGCNLNILPCTSQALPHALLLGVGRGPRGFRRGSGDTFIVLFLLVALNSST